MPTGDRVNRIPYRIDMAIRFAKWNCRSDLRRWAYRREVGIGVSFRCDINPKPPRASFLAAKSLSILLADFPTFLFRFIVDFRLLFGLP